MNDIFNFAAALTGANPPKPERGCYECETSINALGIDWDVRVTYNGTPAARAH